MDNENIHTQTYFPFLNELCDLVWICILVSPKFILYILVT